MVAAQAGQLMCIERMPTSTCRLLTLLSSAHGRATRSPTEAQRGAAMKLRIVSDGTPTGTWLLDVDTGKDVDLCVTHATWHCEVDSLATATLVIADVEVDVIGEAAD